MENLKCPYCGKIFHLEYTRLWDELCDDKTVKCPQCNKFSTAHWQETYNEKTGEEFGWFYLEGDYER